MKYVIQVSIPYKPVVYFTGRGYSSDINKSLVYSDYRMANAKHLELAAANPIVSQFSKIVEI